jgi:hypothetical protein
MTTARVIHEYACLRIRSSIRKHHISQLLIAQICTAPCLAHHGSVSFFMGLGYV